MLRSGVLTRLRGRVWLVLLAAAVSVTIITLALAPQLRAADTDTDGDGLTDAQEQDINNEVAKKELRVAPALPKNPCLGKPADSYHPLRPTLANSGGSAKNDGAEDFDGDGLNNAQDAKAGFEAYNWNSYDNDTTSDACEDADEDHLTTLQEVQYPELGLKPNTPDTNGNGTTDDLEDYDGDGLDNWEDYAARLLPTEGITTVGTDPEKPIPADQRMLEDNLKNLDTDGLNNAQEFNPPPALRDPERPSMVFDPLDEDTDGDGTPDHLDTGGGFDGRAFKR